nr:glycosyl hydrolase [Granulicella sibirica]
MWKRTVLPLAAACVATSFPSSASPLYAATSIDNLRKTFQSPPDSAKPMVRWWWFGTAVEKPEILLELQQMKADGIGGAELAFVYPEVLDDPAHGLKNLPFLSPEMLDAVTYAQQEARKLGLRIDVTLCSGWPYGGADTPIGEAAGTLRTLEIPLPASATRAPLPKLLDADEIVSEVIVDGSPKHWDASTARPLIEPIPPSTSPRVALFFIAGHTRQQVKRAAVGAEGFVLDPFSHQAVATHLEKVGEPLVKAFGDTPPYAIFSDSLEAYGADWTPTLPWEFNRRRGYNLIPHLPELVAGGTPAAEKVRHDYGRTLTELVNENYLTQINKWAIARNTKFRSQTYGEPAVSFSSQNLAGLPEGEGPQWRAFSTLRWASSANHVFGNNITSGETFTWLHSPVFRATPLDMKAEADIDFIMGENQLIFHGWPYSAPGVPEPGWSLYAAASFNHHNPWHPVLPAVDQYIARISALLREGEPANQVAVLVPTDDAWASFAPPKVTVTGAMKDFIQPSLLSAILSSGYNFDFADAEAINRLGIHHQILVLPPTTRIPLDTLAKINAFAKAGGKVVAVGHLPTLDPDGRSSPELTALANTIPVIPDDARLGKALGDLASPDLKFSESEASVTGAIGFIRRKLPDADLYFVTNTSNLPVSATAAFGTHFTGGEQWDTDTGAARPATPAGTRVTLAPYESRIFVFSQSAPAPAPPFTPSHQLSDLSSGWNVSFSALGKSTPEPALTDWTSDPATRNYSGEAVYARTFRLPATLATVYLKIDGGTALPGSPSSTSEHPALLPNGLPDPKVTRTGPGMHAYYDPPIREAALVTVNGQPAGALWHPPYRLDISKFLKSGENKIELHVYNTALNAWSALPPHDYKPLIQKYGDRFQMQDLDKVQPIPSGILGKIYLVTGEEQ